MRLLAMLLATRAARALRPALRPPRAPPRKLADICRDAGAAAQGDGDHSYRVGGRDGR